MVKMLTYFSKITIVLALFLILTTCTLSEVLANDKAIEKIAQEENISTEEVKEILDTGCESGTTLLMRRCAYYHYKIADIEMNEVYNKVKNKLTSEAQEKLTTAQRAWIKYRDAVCEYENIDWEGGTGYRVVILGCMQNYTEERTKHLKEYLNCKDSNCPPGAK